MFARLCHTCPCDAPLCKRAGRSNPDAFLIRMTRELAAASGSCSFPGLSRRGAKRWTAPARWHPHERNEAARRTDKSDSRHHPDEK